MKTNTTVRLTKWLAGPVLSLMLITGNLSAATAGGEGGVPEQIRDLQSQVGALQATVANQAVLIADLPTTNTAQAALITTLQGQVSELSTRLQ